MVDIPVRLYRLAENLRQLAKVVAEGGDAEIYMLMDEIEGMAMDTHRLSGLLKGFAMNMDDMARELDG